MRRCLRLTDIFGTAVCRDERGLIKELLDRTSSAFCLWIGEGDLFVSSLILSKVSRELIDREASILIDELCHKHGMQYEPSFLDVDIDERNEFLSETIEPIWKEVVPAITSEGCIGGYLICSFEPRRECGDFLQDIGKALSISISMRKLDIRLDRASDRFLQIAELGSIFVSVGETLETESRILELALSASGADTGAIVRMISDSDIKYVGISESILSTIQFKDKTKLIDRLLEQKKSLILVQDELDRKLEIESTPFVIQTLLSFPLSFEEKYYGSLVVFNAKKSFVKEASFIAMMETFSRLAGAALTAQERHAERIENEKLEKEINAARAIQTSLIPKSFPNTEGVKISGLWKPSRSVGGDYYDAFQLSDRALGVMIADVSGKGIPAGLLMALSRTYLKVIGIDHKYFPSDTMTRLNLYLCDEMATNKFITANYLTIDMAKRKMRLANAGHLSPILVDRSGSARLISPEFGGLPLGVDIGEKYDEIVMEIESGTMIILYTDGLVEARNENNDLLGIENVLKFIEDFRKDEQSEILEYLWNKTLEFAGEPDDDWTCMAIKFE